MISLRKCLAILVWTQSMGAVHPYAINTNQTSLTLIDSRTEIVARTLFLNEAADAIVDGLLWKDLNPGNGTEILNYRTFVNGDKVYEGFILLPEDPSDLPTMIKAGVINVNKSGTKTILVQFWVGDTMASATIQVQAYKKWVVILPCLAMCGFGLIREFHILYTLFIGLFIGGCMVTGSLIDGFKSIATKYLVAASSDAHHVYLYIFTVCVAGLAAMIRRSGGISAVAEIVSRYSKSFRLSQILLVIAGIALFFDPYASIILVAEIFSPYMRFFPVSLEKQSFLLQVTGLPVSAINPLSTWVGFSSALIQTQLDKLVTMGHSELTIPDDGWTVFTRSIKYQFYPIFLLFLMAALVLSRRELGPMLITERERWLFIKSGGISPWTLREKIARPDASTPRHVRNMVVPCVVWCAAIWTTFALVNDPDDPDNATDFTAALLYCTIGVAAFTQVFFFIQKKWVAEKFHGVTAEDIEATSSEGLMKNSMEEKIGNQQKIGLANSTDMNADFILKNLASVEDTVMLQTSIKVDSEEDPEDKSVVELQEECIPIVSMKEGGECFFRGGATVIPVLMTLTLAWATTEMLLDLGVDRLFGDLINRGHLKLELYPAVGFLVSFLVALSTGSFMAAQTIVLPLLSVPLYEATVGGQEELFYSLVGAVLSGSVLGDQASPISTSSILSSFMIECDMRKHIVSQTPYIIVVALISLFFGHFPSGSERFPYYASYIMGFVLLGAFVYFLCQDVLDSEGTYDFFTEFCCSETSSLRELKSRMRVMNGMSKSDEALLDTDSASEDPDSDHDESIAESNAHADVELEVEYYSDESSVEDSSASSSYYSDGNDRSRSGFRRYASALMPSRPRSRSRSRSVNRHKSRAYDQDKRQDRDSDSDSLNRRKTSRPQGSSPRSRRASESSRRRPGTQSRRVSEESVSSGEDDSQPTTTSASENGRYTSGTDDYTTDGEAKSHVTRMRSRVMKWLGHTIGENNDNDDESQEYHASKERQRPHKKYTRRQDDF